MILAGSARICICREETCGSPICSIRKCVLERNIELCPCCEDYPCYRIEELAKGYPRF
ncbi:hypothetical protein JW877_03210 [bacterium]|nr:hypothetical protein [bacterium]